MGALGVELGFDDLLKFDLHILKFASQYLLRWVRSKVILQCVTSLTLMNQVPKVVER